MENYKDMRIAILEELLSRIAKWEPVVQLYDDGDLSVLRGLMGEANVVLLHTKYANKS